MSAIVDTRTREAVEEIIANQRERDRLAEANKKLEIDLSVSERHVAFFEGEVARLTQECNFYMRFAAAMKTRLTDVAIAQDGVKRIIAELIDSAEEKATAELNPPEPTDARPAAADAYGIRNHGQANPPGADRPFVPEDDEFRPSLETFGEQLQRRFPPPRNGTDDRGDGR